MNGDAGGIAGGDGDGDGDGLGLEVTNNAVGCVGRTRRLKQTLVLGSKSDREIILK